MQFFPVVGIGASAGGLEACQKLIDTMPAGNGMAFILIQHLDPTHVSMLVDLLTPHTTMTVCQASDGMMIEPDHLYIIAPGTYLAVGGGALRISTPPGRQGARLPFDFLLLSLAEEYGARAIAVILSGTGADGSVGLKAIKEKFGLVIVQDPLEASYDGMPRNAIGTGAVDLVLPAAKIPEALIKYQRRMSLASSGDGLFPEERLSEIIDLLRTKTPHDFRFYKQGTLLRRIERRMAMAAIESDDLDRYLALLRGDGAELDLLAKDLLINVTRFFRDTAVFDLLAKKVIPELVRDRAPDQPLRLWIAGCSSGEETYSLTMLFLEAITAARTPITLQVFASDIDGDAVATAREGLYPETIAADISPARLARFFVKEDHRYRVSADLRAAVVFAVQDVLADPPFSRLDMVSCRNLLIYLRPEAQAKVMSLLHFALREGGILLLGSAETVGSFDSSFKVISKPERVYRHVARSRPGDLNLWTHAVDSARPPLRPGGGQVLSRQDTLARLCRRLVMDNYAPAAVLINNRQECLFSLGPVDRYLRVAPGRPSHDVLTMARQNLRVKLTLAIQQARQTNARLLVDGGSLIDHGATITFDIALQPVLAEGEDLLLICFIDKPRPKVEPLRPSAPGELPPSSELERELLATREELEIARRTLEISTEEQKAINEEAMSVNEEYQSTNEELVTSKEELQSLNEELTALNSQLQETLERQRTTADDLQNILYSTDVATIFLDTELQIRFFTPATKSLFSVLPTDVGRPLADLNFLAADVGLLADAQTVLKNFQPTEREIESQNGTWYLRRILPYRVKDKGVEGVVITFSDITERRRIAQALGAAKREAELANIAKSRFLAAASHDLRQPLQSLALLQGMLEKSVQGEKAQKLVARLGDSLGAMAGMLNTLLDINQIEAGVVQSEIVHFPINDLLGRLRDEFAYGAESQGLRLHFVPCGLSIDSDPQLLEQVLRNLLSNALKYTRSGKVLMGCRRRKGMLSVEIWDTGVGIPAAELGAIFEEYHQLDNSARERSRGLGLGLSIVKRLANLLDHQIRVRSNPGKGSVFIVDILLPNSKAPPPAKVARSPSRAAPPAGPGKGGAVMIVEDDPDVSQLLALLLGEEGYVTSTASSGVAALTLVTRAAAVRPDLILADYNLPNGLNGLDLAVQLREKLGADFPVVILTGDISSGTLRDICLQGCTPLNKPVKPQELIAVIAQLLRAAPAVPRQPTAPPAETSALVDHSMIYVVDDDAQVRAEIRHLLEENGRTVTDFVDAESFLASYKPGRDAVLLLDACLPGMDGLVLLRHLSDSGLQLPTVMITGKSSVPMAVDAMKSGVSDFLEKPFSRAELLTCIDRALEQTRDKAKLEAWRIDAAKRVAGLTPRQHEIMQLVLAGHPSKNIAADLSISQRTVENHRASIMEKTGSKSLPALARLAFAASPDRP